MRPRFEIGASLLQPGVSLLALAPRPSGTPSLSRFREREGDGGRERADHEGNDEP